MVEPTADFVALWTRYQPDVRRYVFMVLPHRGDADDVIQETAAALLQKFPEYDAKRPFLPWAIHFAYLEVLRWRQRQSRSRLVFSDELVAQLDSTVAEESPMLEIRRKILDGCLQKLRRRDRELLLVRYSRQGGLRQRAEQAGLSSHKLYYAVEKLRAILLECIKTTMGKEGWDHA